VWVADSSKSMYPSKPDLLLVETAGIPIKTSLELPYDVSDVFGERDEQASIPPLSRPQNADQKSKSFKVISPRSSRHPSNQFSQLTLQLGNQALWRSIRMNLGCMTEKGRMNMLFTTKSKPPICSGAGKPSLVHESGGYM
jgi:hypothetical protein